MLDYFSESKYQTKTGTVREGDKSKILPEAESAVACSVEGVEPRSCQVAQLVDDVVSQLLGEGEGEVVSRRVEEEREEDILVGAGQWPLLLEGGGGEG